MSASIEQLAADISQIKAMLEQLLGGGLPLPVVAKEGSTIIEEMEQARLLGLDPLKAVERFRVSRPRRNTKRREQ